MNIVKGVADLLRRSSGGDQAEDNASWSRSNKLSAPSLNICFRDVGEEALLRNIWDKYNTTIGKAEKRKLLLEFLKYFVQIYHKWEPANDGEFLTDSSQGTSSQSLGPKNLVLGCSFGHPSEVILILIQEVAHICALVSESNAYSSQGAPESSLKLGDEIFCVLDSMIIITRSVHNCRVLSYYGGVQKVTALMKAVVIQLKALSAGVSSDGHLSGMDLEKTELLLRILTYVISTIFSFMNLNPDVHAKIQHITARNYLLKDCRFKIPSDILLKPVPEATYHWQQKAVILMMEAGGVNWLVELLRVIRRLGLKEQWTRWLLEHLTLSCLKCALLKNTRAQNHFRSIGGLEVLLDALALSSSSLSVLGDIFLSESEGGGSSFFAICELQLFFLEVLRDSVFGNLNNLQFLCENGRIQKFANSICSPAYMLQEFQNYMLASSESRPGVYVSTPTTEFSERIHSSSFLVQDSTNDPDSSWTEYCLKLSQLLCSFLVSNEDVNHNMQASSGQCSAPISFVYWELSIKWFMKILMAAFPCIRACSSGNVLPSNLRILANSLQHHTLLTFRKFLAGAPKLLEVFREEGIWDFIFSERFFYFGAFLEEFSTEADSCRDDSSKIHGMPSTSKFSKDSIKHNEVVILQMEAISFLEFAATLCGNTYNLPECSSLLDTLEQSACNPEIAIMLVKSLHRILQLATERTFAALEELDAIARLLKVTCIQAQEYRKFGDTKAQKEFHMEGQPIDSHTSGLVGAANTWVECMKALMDLFTEYLSSSHHGRSLVLHNAKCIDCLFNLLWEECLASQILDHILGLMKIPASPSADRVAMLQLCSKYLETFTIAKEKGSDFVELAIDLLVGMKDVLLLDQLYYQALFREAECFLHIVSMLNGTVDDKFGEPLILNVLQTLTLLLAGNDMSKSAFRALAGVGYQTLQNLLLDFCHSQPSLGLLNALLDMLVDGRFVNDRFSLIKNEDAVMLFLVVLQKSSATLQHYGLDILLRLVKDSIINRIISSKAGMLGFILDWFFLEEAGDVLMKLAQLIQIIGGHSVSGKDIRKMFAILRSEKMGSNQKYSSLLLTSIYSMLKEKGPTAFFDFSGHDSGIVIKTPVQWPYNRGFSFSCWIRIESFPETELMSLFCFFTDNGRGSSAMIGKDKLVFESINQKRQSVELSMNFIQKKWHFLCITHSIGRAFSGGSIMRCYLDGDLVSSDKCRYAKITDALTRCSIGSHISVCDELYSRFPSDYVMPFLGQIGPVYMFGDALSPEQVKGIYLLGPTYMYSFIGNEVSNAFDSSHPLGLFDAKDGFSSKIVFGLNAQASDGRILFNVSTVHEQLSDKNVFEAAVLEGTRLCCRRMLKEIIYCVGGVSVFFPLLTPLDCSGTSTANDYLLMRSVTSNKLAGEVIELVASVLDENLANQQQMHLLSGFPILGFLFQHVPPKHLNMEMLSSLKRLFHIVKSCGMSELLLKDAISWIYLNPQIWTFVDYEVQRELYMFLIQHFENDMAHLKKICDLPRVIDIICQFYWDKADCSLAFGTKSLLNLATRQVIPERPCAEEIRKIRLLLLSFAEMSLMPKVEKSDMKALIAFFERSNDMVCIEDVLQMVLRTFSQKVLLASFLEQVNLLGGCSIFVNLLQRDSEPIRLLGLQLLGKLLTGFPSEKKGQIFFSLSVGRSRLVSDSNRKSGLTRVEPLILVMSDRLFRFPLSDNLCATLFDVLLGGASPKQILQKRSLSEKNINKKGRSGLSTHFCVPQILILIFNFLASCNDSSAREKILKDLLDLLDSSPSNIEALAENGWCYWLDTSSKLDILQSLEVGGQSGLPIDSNKNEEYLVRNVFSIVLSNYIFSMKGGWQKLEETVNFLLLHSEQGRFLNHDILFSIFVDLVGSLLEISPADNIFISQPCRDNVLYLLKLMDEMLATRISDKFLFPYCILDSDIPSDSQPLDSQVNIKKSITKILNDEDANAVPRSLWCSTPRNDLIDGKWWGLCDKLWTLICEMNGKRPDKNFIKSSGAAGPSFGQRARGLVESLNIPAAEMAAVVVSGGIGGALSGKGTKSVDKAMLLRGEKCPRIVFRLVIMYLCGASLERASKCVQQFIMLLPCLLPLDDEQNKNKLQQYIWYIAMMRSKFENSQGDQDSSCSHIMSNLIHGMVNYGKSILSTATLDVDEALDINGLVIDQLLINNLIQIDRVSIATVDEVTYIKSSKTDRYKQLEELKSRIDEDLVEELRLKKTLEEEIRSDINDILSSDDKRRAAYKIVNDENQQTVAEKWMHLLRALIDERGPWSANAISSSTLVHWKHDKTEDFWRRRPKLKRNYHFDEKLCHSPAIVSPNETSCPVSDSSGDKSFPEQMKHLLLKGVRGIIDEGSLEPCDDAHDATESKISDLDTSAHNQVSKEEFKDVNNSVHDMKSSLPSAEDKETSEVLLHIPCVLVTPKRKVAGHLSVMQTILRFSGNFLVEGTGGSSVFKKFDVQINSISSSLDQIGETHKKNLPRETPKVDNNSGKASGMGNKSRSKKIKRHWRWKITKIKSVHWTRYLLQYTAIEIFFNDSIAPVFLNFASSKDAKSVGTLIVSSRNEALYPRGSVKDRTCLISFVDRRVAVEMAETARESWKRREMSNFEYLIILNTLAGRSYNDLTQYPVFPWVLADYTSEKLDFNKSSTFRDLSKPVGALDQKRFEVFEDRYRNFCDPDIPSFFYGSHYSGMGIVLFYLLRMEPFTALHRNLQGGKFDHADRLFQSIGGTYSNCLSNTSDVKELIPEFFYMPEFLVNLNSYHLGIKQDGEPLADVVLPPWAKGSPEEFIYRNREALESEFVSSNLHHWIDLVFGYKQRGKPAVEAANVFYYLTYEGAVDLEAMDDELQISAIEDQIANFGQTPIQIFRKKHPRRGPPVPIAHPLYFAPASITLTSVVSNAAQSVSALLFIDLLDSNIVIVNEQYYLTVKMWITTQLQSGGNFTFSSSQDPFFGIGSDVLPLRRIGTPIAESSDLTVQCFATLQAAGDNYLISCGSWDNSFQVTSLSDGKTVQSIRQHKDVVSCIAVTSDGSVIATGSYDTTVMVWNVCRTRIIEKRLRSTEFTSKDHVIVESPLHILCGHDDIITCLFVSVELDIVISGSKDGTCIFHTLREGRYVRSIQHPSRGPLSKLVVSQHGLVVIYAESDLSLHMYSINGKHLAFCESNGRLNCIKLSVCGEFLACAGDHGHITLRSMHSLEIVRRYEGTGKTIMSLVVTPEECFLAGTKDGTLLVYSIENPQLRKVSLPRTRS